MTSRTTPSMTEEELDRALRAVGDDLDRMAAGYRARNASSRSVRRLGVRRIGLAAASLGAFAAAAFAISSRFGDDRTDIEDASAADIVDVPAPEAPAPLSVGQREAVVGSCTDALDRFVADIPPEIAESMPWRSPSIEAAEVVMVPHADDPDTVEVIIAEASAGWHCSVRRDIRRDAGDRSVQGQMFFSDSRLVVGGDLAIRTSSWLSNTEAGDVGPGSATFAGQVGDDVSSITFALADGTSYPASIADGWFYAHTDVDSGVALFDDVVEWTLADGSVRRAPTAFLDGLDEDEACALDADCFAAATSRLEAQLDSRPDLYAGGELDAAAIRAERETWAQCARDQGHDVRIEDDGFVYTSPPSDQPVARTVFPDEELLAACDRSIIDVATRLQRLRELRSDAIRAEGLMIDQRDS